MRLGILASVLSFGMAAGLAPAADPDSGYQPGAPANDPEPLSLLPVPKIKLAPPIKANDAEAKEIRQLIKGLAEIDELHSDVSSRDVGRACLVPVLPNQHVLSLGHPEAGPFSSFQAPAFDALVQYGPKAIPFLLEALDDDSPTMLSFAQTARFQSIGLDSNPVNATEATALKQVETPKKDKRSGRYTVTVGDICLAVLGQITNRPYSVVWMQPALFNGAASPYLVQSPIENKALAEVVRKIWGGSDHAQKLLNSLLIDFNTRGAGSDDFQCGSAMRLAFYFPDEASSLIADRLGKLDLTNDDLTAQLVYCISWSPDPRIASEVLKIFEKTPHSVTVLACLPGMNKDYDDAVIQRLIEFLNEPNKLDIPYCDCLVAIGKRFPNRASQVFQKYIETGNVEHFQQLCDALTKTCGNLSIDLLGPLLSDKSTTGIFIVRNDIVERQRTCDLAASTIAVNCPDMPFELMDSAKRRDQQIEAMKRKIAEMKKAEK